MRRSILEEIKLAFDKTYTVKLVKIDLSKFLDKAFYGLFLDRRSDNKVHFIRQSCLLVLHNSNLDDIRNKKFIDKEDLFLNPLMFLQPVHYDENMLPWENIDDLKVKINGIKNWAFKSEQVPFSAKGILLKCPWELCLSDSEIIYDLSFTDNWSNLDYFSFYPHGAFDFRIALEVL
jgi:hypothetical protein